MTIEKGVEWGSAFEPTGDEPVADSDADAMAHIERALRAGEVPGPVVLRGGDLFRMLGGRPAVQPRRFPVDVLEVVADGRTSHALGHVIARRRGWAGRFVVLMNGQFVGARNLGPRAHPNDGLLDVTDGALDLSDRLQARRRARTGTHLPHPALSTSRVAAAEFTFESPVGLWIDDRRSGTCRSLRVRVLPDAATIAI